MQKRPKFACYNDGVVNIYREIDRRSNFGAKLNATALDDLEFLAKLAFEEQSKRQQDIEFAEQQGFSLTLKIRTRYIKGVDNKCKAVVNDFLYDIDYVDATKTDLYLYMQGVGELASTD